jgi:glycosyltransferase involved in cell wall biosynthesis
VGSAGRMSGRDAVFVVVGAYNEASVIARVVSELQMHCAHVVVVDDGSTDETTARARQAGAVVLSHIVNRGQGAALQTGIKYSLSRGARYIVTFDADGQHCADELPRLLDPIRSAQVDIALGSRFLGRAENIPPLRRLLLRAGAAFTRAVSGGRFTDAHNGFRAFSRRAASRLNLSEDRMAHASELIDEVVASGLPYMEVPVTIRYTAYSQAKGQRLTASFGILLDYLLRKILGPA